MINFYYKNTCGLAERQIRQETKKLSDYLGDLNKKMASVKKTRQPAFAYDFPEASILVPFETKRLSAVKNLSHKLEGNKRLGKIIVIGIGGSNLGTLAIYLALLQKCGREIVFADTIDPGAVARVQQAVSLDFQQKRQPVIFIISKSGQTFETAANFGVLLPLLKRFWPARFQNQVVAITDNHSPLQQYAQANHFQVVTIPKMVGGRYSVLSEVGLLPLYLAGVNIDQLIQGAKRIVQNNLALTDRNQPLTAAATLYLNFKKGKLIYNNFIFDQKLEGVGLWYRQLLAESLGKKYNLQEKIVHTGILPILSYGHIDLHSIGQHYFEGQRNIFTSFIEVEKDEIKLAQEQIVGRGLNHLIANLEGKDIKVLRRAIITGVKQAYQKLKLPYTEFRFNKVDEENLGEFLQTRMLEVMFLGKLMDINPFNQPGVELYKSEARKLLRRH